MSRFLSQARQSALRSGIFIALIAVPVFAQQAPPPAQQPQSPALTQTSAAPDATKANPDYPDRRTFTIGLFYWLSIPNGGPDHLTGKQANFFSDLKGLGGDKPGPGFEVSMPITRTGELHLDAFQVKGSGNQILPVDTVAFSTAFFKNDALATTNKVQGLRLYLDDLLYPHKFPVSKLRYRSIWAVRVLRLEGTVNDPGQKDANGNVVGAYATGRHQLVLPEFGAAMEYAIARHALFRLEGSGFGLPSHAYVWEGGATLSARKGRIEVLGGFKALGYRTSPKPAEYFRGIIDGGYVGLRYHFQ